TGRTAILFAAGATRTGVAEPLKHGRSVGAGKHARPDRAEQIGPYWTKVQWQPLLPPLPYESCSARWRAHAASGVHVPRFVVTWFMRARASDPIHAASNVGAVMKLSARLTALKKQKQSKPRQAGSGQRPGGRFSRWGLAWLALGLMAAGAGTLAALELFVWNKVPPALVGTWEVEEGPQYGGTFAFSRTG